jgi:hypothetical protein
MNFDIIIINKERSTTKLENHRVKVVNKCENPEVIKNFKNYLLQTQKLN